MTPIIEGLLFGIVIGVIATALCFTAGEGDPEPTQESDPHEQRDADK